MKCHKCGYVSFDYLSQCKKCGTDLTAVRASLGFSDVKSEAPSLLGALLKQGVKPGGAQARLSDQDGHPTEETLPGLDRQATKSPNESTVKSLQDSERQAAVDLASKEDLVIELSEDDLQALAGIDKK